MLKFENLCLTLQQKILISNASGTVHAGETITLTGTSGSGKSLLLRILASILKPNTGSLTWYGKTLQQLTPQQWRSKIGFIQQMPALIDGTVIENLQLPFTFQFYQNQVFNLSWHQEQLEILGKSQDFLQQSSQNLSGGERQLVNLLRCLQLHPSLLLLDEPTAALDPTTAHQVETLVAHWQRAIPERSWLWVSHDMGQTQRLSDLSTTLTKHWQMHQGILTC